MIKVGDTVVFRPKAKASGILPMAVRGRIIELGETEDGQPAAMLDAGLGEPFGVLVENLELEQNE